MTRTKSTYLALVAILLSPIAANADLIMIIEDDGGFARFSLSGSDTVSSGFSNLNGFWVFGPLADSMFNTTGFAQGFALTSGSGTLFTDTVGVSPIYDVYAGPGLGCCTFGVRGANLGDMSAGDNISWSGLFTTTMSFSVLNAGVYDYSQLTSDDDFAAVLNGGLQIRIGAVQVPEPGTLALLGIGLFGMGLSRRRKIT